MPFEDGNGDFAVTVARIAAGKRERVSGQIALGTHAAAYVGIFDHRLNDGGQLAGANIETREVIEVSGDANIDTTGSPHRLAGQRRAAGNFRPKNAKLGHFEGEFDFAFSVSPTTLGFQRQTFACDFDGAELPLFPGLQDRSAAQCHRRTEEAVRQVGHAEVIKCSLPVQPHGPRPTLRRKIEPTTTAQGSAGKVREDAEIRQSDGHLAVTIVAGRGHLALRLDRRQRC